ncbi:MAG: hypothetical protein FWE80_08770 [Oscillospiraceae bacterium]|nr:hypothetical protein [Oscillospiraceae bacterium]
MDDEMRELFEFETIEAAPVYSLAECITAAEQRCQAEVFDDAPDGADPIMEIKERFRSALYLCDAPEHAFLVLAVMITAKKEAWTENMYYGVFRVFAHNDFLYLFLWDEQYYLVLPEELIKIYHEVIAEESFAAVNARNLEMTDYAAALLNLYGAYEIEWFVTVWNHHHKDKITEEQAEKFLSDRACFHADFYFYDWFVVHDCIEEDEFEELWESTEEIDYYMPTKSVIREYSKKGYDDSKIPGEREMEDFLAGYIQDERILETLQFDVKISCERLWLPAVVREALTDACAPLDDEAFCERFERLYNNLRDNTHIWELHGFTPHQYTGETGNNLKRFVLPPPKTYKNKKQKRKYESREGKQ